MSAAADGIEGGGLANVFDVTAAATKTVALLLLATTTWSGKLGQHTATAQAFETWTPSKSE